MRQIVLDTETTGLEVTQGHRVIEIGCVELQNRRLTGNHFHHYLNPDRAIDAAAVEVHGLNNEFLADKPRFTEIAADFLDYIKGAELIIHNAPFDVGFLDNELELWNLQWGPLAKLCSVLDSLVLARRLHPGQKNSLDALCRRYGVDNSQRTLHGALLDAEILADVYLAMTGGQVALSLDAGVAPPPDKSGKREVSSRSRMERPSLTIVRATEEECLAHSGYLDVLDKSSGGNCIWKRLEADG